MTTGRHHSTGPLVGIVQLFSRFFYTFLDINGVLLGLFLLVSGWWMIAGRPISRGYGGVVLALGVAAFIIHTGHYFQLRITKWIFGTEGYFHKDRK
jgi:hypothetical protein